LTWEERELAAILAAGETALASHRAAARLHGIGDFGSTLVEITLTHETVVHVTEAIVHRSRRVLAPVMAGPIPCTSVEQTLLDLAAVLPARLVHRAFTTAWRERLTTPGKVRVHLRHHGGRGVKGTRALREIAELYGEAKRGPGSEAEADLILRLFAELDARGIERPELQGLVDVDGGRRKVSCDCLWASRKKALEMMGLSAHGDYVTHDDDTERASDIRAAGFDLMELTPRAVRERPDRTIRKIVAWLLA
jgi:hypothetical protein